MERRLTARVRQNKGVWWTRFTHSSLFSLQPAAFCRGCFIGMFWACIPMPFQMIPATLFCMIGYGNLPIALLAVWISNPFTYLPIFYLEYQIGVFLFGGGGEVMTQDEFSRSYEALGDALLLTLKGGLVLATAAAILGYVAGYPLSAYLRALAEKRRRRRHAHKS